jgi:hypothetical protein
MELSRKILATPRYFTETYNEFGELIAVKEQTLDGSEATSILSNFKIAEYSNYYQYVTNIFTQKFKNTAEAVSWCESHSDESNNYLIWE